MEESKGSKKHLVNVCITSLLKIGLLKPQKADVVECIISTYIRQIQLILGMES